MKTQAHFTFTIATIYNFCLAGQFSNSNSWLSQDPQNLTAAAKYIPNWILILSYIQLGTDDKINKNKNNT